MNKRGEAGVPKSLCINHSILLPLLVSHFGWVCDKSYKGHWDHETDRDKKNCLKKVWQELIKWPLKRKASRYEISPLTLINLLETLHREEREG